MCSCRYIFCLCDEEVGVMLPFKEQELTRERFRTFVLDPAIVHSIRAEQEQQLEDDPVPWNIALTPGPISVVAFVKEDWVWLESEFPCMKGSSDVAMQLTKKMYNMGLVPRRYDISFPVTSIIVRQMAMHKASNHALAD